MTLHEIHCKPFFAQFLEANHHFITLITYDLAFPGKPRCCIANHALAHRLYPSAKRLSRHGKPSCQGTMRRATCTPEHRMTSPPVWRGNCRAQHLAEMRNDLLGKELELPLCLIPRHKSLVKEPAKPLQFTLAPVESLQRGDFGADLFRRACQGVLDSA